MSQEKVEFRRSLKHGPVTSGRTTVIQRTPAGMGGFAGQRTSTMRMSMGGAPTYTAGTLTSMSHKGVNDVITNRDKEKKDMQGLNERFASYIEKVRFLEAQNKALLAEIERLKKLKGFDVSEIKELYETELAECRKIIKDLSDEKASFDSTLAGLQDALDDEKRERAEAEKDNCELRNKLDRLNDQIGEYEGEVTTLRGRVNGLEDEVSKLRTANKRFQDDIARLRADLDTETTQRINAECRLHELEDDLRFQLTVADAEIKELKALLDRDKGTEMRDIWKGEMSNAVKELQKEYDNQLSMIRADCEMQYQNKYRELQAGVSRDNNEAALAREEVKKLKSKMGGMNPRMIELESENARLMAQIRALQSDLDDLQRDRDCEVAELQEKITKLEQEMEGMMVELQVLADAKLSLELEISCYRKLLEGEEQSLKHVVEEATGARSKGANQLADIVQKGSISSSESVGRMVVNRTCRGSITFDDVKLDGTCVTLANNNSGKGAKSQNLKGWKIRRMVGSKEKRCYEFKNNIELGPQQKLKIFALDAEAEAGYNDLVTDFSSWEGGPGNFVLIEPIRGDEKASLSMKMT